MPLSKAEVEERAFDGNEPLFRRFSPKELNSRGEVVPSSLNSMSWSKELNGAPSVLRGAFADAGDALSSDCAGGRDVSSYLAFQIVVADLPTSLAAGGDASFDFFPVHQPLETCGAHSVVASCTAGDAKRMFCAPPKLVRNAFRVKLATRFRPSTQVDTSSESPIDHSVSS